MRLGTRCRLSQTADVVRGSYVPILLQKSKVASVRIFGETLKHEAIDDSDNLSRATEVAYEFSARRRGPSDPYTKTAPAALGIFDTFCKATFATISAQSGHIDMSAIWSLSGAKRTSASGCRTNAIYEYTP